MTRLPTGPCDPQLKKYLAEKVWIRISQHIPQAMRKHASLQVIEDRVTNDLITEIDTYMYGMANQRVTVHKQWPADWWQAIKVRWFPKWAIRRWPVRYHRIDIDQPIYLALCPHVEDDPNSKHLEWMAQRWDEESLDAAIRHDLTY